MNLSTGKASPDACVADLSSWSVRVAWHEAVALVHHVGSRAVIDPESVGVPHIDRTFITIDGYIQIVPSPGDPDAVVVGLSDMLGSLLTDDAPADLRTLGDSALPDVRGMGAQEYLSALTFFARPDEHRELRALAFRAHTSRDSLERASALQALTDKARQAVPATQEAAPRLRKPLPSRKILILSVVGLAACTILVGAYLLTRFGSLPRTGVAPIDEVAQAVAQRVQSGSAASMALVQDAIAGKDAPVPVEGKDRVLVARRPRAAKTSPKGSPLAAEMSRDVPAPPAAEEYGAEVPLSEVGDLPVVGEAAGTVYSVDHLDVMPPTLSRAQMPQTLIEGIPQDRPGALELLVDTDGRVVSAKLVPASGRFQDRMMVSAAKTWRFDPATREGHPVRYRLPVPITW